LAWNEIEFGKPLDRINVIIHTSDALFIQKFIPNSYKARSKPRNN